MDRSANEQLNPAGKMVKCLTPRFLLLKARSQLTSARGDQLPDDRRPRLRGTAPRAGGLP